MMESLSETRLLLIKKMSTDRLKARLLSIDYDTEDAINELDRDSLIAAWADAVASGMDKRSAPSVVAYDPELEKQKLELEKLRLQQELELQMKQMEMQERLKREELEIKRMELERYTADKEKNTATQVKLFGDALRNAVARMSTDPMEIIAFFRSIEQTFETLKVPNELKSALVRPFLNDKAKSLVAQMDPEVVKDYERMRDALLKEFKLTPNAYLQRFNTLKRLPDETAVMYASKLRSLLDYYLDSRCVNSYDKLKELLLCDRLKVTLSESCLNHVLSVENATAHGWLGIAELTSTVDRYWASNPADRPRAYAIGQKPNCFESVGQNRTQPTKTKSLISSSSGDEQENADNRPNRRGEEPKINPGGKRCNLCNSRYHLAYTCPKSQSSRVNESRGTPRNDERYLKRVNVCRADHTEENENTETNSHATEPIEANTEAAHKVAKVAIAKPPTDVNSGVMQEENLSVKGRPDIEVTPAEFFTGLNYVSVELSDQPEPGSGRVVSALADSGANVCVVKKSLVDDWQCTPVAEVSLIGFVGNPIPADVINLYVKLNEDHVKDHVVTRYVAIKCAVSNNIHEDLILTSDAVNKLMHPVNARCNEVDVTVDALKEADGDDHVSNDVQNNDQTLTLANDMQDIVRTTVLQNQDVINGDDKCQPDSCRATANEMINEQRTDESLKGCWALAQCGKGGFVINDGLLYHSEKILSQAFLQLCLPKGRRLTVLQLAHDTAGGHLAARKTRDRIRFTFYWPTLMRDVRQYIQACEVCQKRARITCRDRVPITPIPRAERAFSHWFMDCAGPLFNHKVEFNYALILVDSATRWPAAYALKSLTARNVCDAILQLWQFTGCGNEVSSDCGSNFTSQLTQEFLKRLGCSPRFTTPGHPQGNGLAERMVGSVKSMISKLAADHPKQWHKYLGFALWALREVPNETTGTPPWVLAFGHLPRGPLSILKETWIGERELPLNLGKNIPEFLKVLHSKLQIAEEYAKSQTDKNQVRYATRYNLRSLDKHFSVGERVLILHKDSTASRTFSRWKGPATIVEVRSPYSYLVEIDGARRVYHANQLRKFHVRVNEVSCDSFAVGVNPELYYINSCAVIHEEDTDFGDIPTFDSGSKQEGKQLPSQLIDRNTLSHLSEKQQRDLLDLLDRYSDCFSEKPGFTNVVEHAIPISSDFKPKRLKAYRVPERLKGEVDRQIQEMLEQGIIQPSQSPMASPLVCVLKGKYGKNGIRLAVDYRYVNRFTLGDAFPTQDISNIIQRVGRAKFITVCDAKSGYCQTPVKPEDRWLTAFCCDSGLFEFKRTPFGMKSSGATFVRGVQEILRPIKEFADAYVDDMACFSNSWNSHLNHLEKFLAVIKRSGLTLSLKKCKFAQNEVKFCGEIIGSGTRRADPEKVAAVKDMNAPKTKTELRRALGFFSFFREHIPQFAATARSLTDLTSKKVPK
jgi:transposase InsO family protein